MNQTEINKLAALRRTLHQYPEISGNEKKTSARIKAFFETLNPDGILEDLGPFGLAFIFKGPEEGPTLMLRTELDAILVQEDGKIKHRSKHKGVSHSCGHDGHMAIVCGVGMKLSEERPKKGRVVLLFQPSEETGMGAEQVLQSKNFKHIIPDYIFALHNLPGHKKHQIILKKGAFTAASKGMTISLKGRTSHAAHPEDGLSPGMAMCKLMVGLQKLPESIKDFTMITVIHASLGEVSFGTSPGEATVMATLRTFENPAMEKLTDYSEKLAQLVAKESGLELKISYSEEFETAMNDEKSWELVNESAKALGMKTKHIRTPFRWSEDFGKFSSLSHTNSMLFGIGAGEKQPQLHESHYDFPDEIIPTAVNLYLAIIRKINF
jgi:amidohydrolase